MFYVVGVCSDSPAELHSDWSDSHLCCILPLSVRSACAGAGTGGHVNDPDGKVVCGTGDNKDVGDVSGVCGSRYTPSVDSLQSIDSERAELHHTPWPCQTHPVVFVLCFFGVFGLCVQCRGAEGV